MYGKKKAYNLREYGYEIPLSNTLKNMKKKTLKALPIELIDLKKENSGGLLSLLGPKATMSCSKQGKMTNNKHIPDTKRGRLRLECTTDLEANSRKDF